MAQESTSPTLTDISYIGRQTVKFGIIFVVLFMVGRTALTVFTAYWKATHPDPPPPPTVGFGALPALEFPVKDDSEKPLSYKLETATGGLPDFGDRAKVFLMVPQSSSPSLFDDDRAKQLAATIGFVFEPIKLNAYTYRFSKSNPLEATLKYNVLTDEFSITTDYLTRSSLLTSNSAPDQQTALDTVVALLGEMGLLGDDLVESTGEVVYLKALGDQTAQALSFSEADFAEVGLSRVPLDDEYYFYAPDGTQDTIRAIVTGAYKGIDAILEMTYAYQPVDYSQVHTYPLRTATEAWRLLQAGEGYVANKGKSDTAVIRQVDLGYYDSFAGQEYMQPIYVFRGDEDFIGYVPAVSGEYIQNQVLESEN